VSSVVLDASVILAVLRGETLDHSILGLLEGACISTVNIAEILTKVQDDPLIEDDAAEGILALLQAPQPFTAKHARFAAQLRPATKPAGLSLGDRACIALGAELDADIYTADRAWAKAKLPYRIHIIR
jgi:ribonuclease VapC